MRSLITVLFFIAVSFLCWGLYGPVLHEGQYRLGVPGSPSSLRPLICVGIAYFLIAVVVPLGVLGARGEAGRWTVSGAFWSFLAGAAGAVGALGITLAFKYGGRPIFVMPLVFGLAPVINTLVTMTIGRTFRQANPIFISGVILVAIGAAGVMFFKPVRSHTAVPPAPVAAQAEAEAPAGSAAGESGLAESGEHHPSSDAPGRLASWGLVLLFIAVTACCWGCYGPVLHAGQMRMSGSRLRPFLCVGLAYFAVAVLAPLPLLNVFREPGDWTAGGVAWSLAGGAAGALGALGIIMSFNFGGKPIYVMPLVFGGAPVVNTFATILHEGTAGEVSPLFYASLMLVIGGAVTVLVFAPRGKHPGKPAAPPEKDQADAAASQPTTDAAALRRERHQQYQAALRGHGGTPLVPPEPPAEPPASP